MSLALILWVSQALYLIGFIASGVLVYRYGRYTEWRTTDIGRAFMMMKVFLMIMFFVLLIRLWLPVPLRIVLVFALIGGIDFALIRQGRVIVKLQGGWQRHGKGDPSELTPPQSR